MSGPDGGRFNPLDAARAASPLTPLAQRLRQRINDEGPVTFADFMRAALYEPGHGYYRRGQPTVGRDGDFLTSPEVHPIFGAAVAHLAAQLWLNLHRPDPFRLLEVGPGTGALVEALLLWLHAHAPDTAQALRLTLIEADSWAADRQRQRLALWTDQIAWRADLPDHAQAHAVVANELLDAIPVHRLQFLNGAWRELTVAHDPQQGFHDLPADLSDTNLAAPLAETPGPDAAEGQIVEIAPERADMVQSLAGLLAPRGLLLLFDYGYERTRLYAPWRRDGTLMTMHRHIPDDAPYRRIGEQDITCHIDIDQVDQAAAQAGLRRYRRLNQAEWLHAVGATALPPVGEAKGRLPDYLAARRAVEQLADPAGLGRIAVMAYARGRIGPLPGLDPA